MNRISILINNAGFAKRVMMDGIEVDLVDYVLAIDTKSPLFVAKHTLPMMRNESTIVYVSLALTEKTLIDALVSAVRNQRGED